MLDCIVSIERNDPEFRERLRRDCEDFAAVASELGCTWLQVVALSDFASDDWATVRHAVVTSLKELAEITSRFGVRLAIEPVSFSPFRSLEHAVDVVHELGLDRVGLVLDTRHLWTGGASWDEVASVDAGLIVAVHVADCQARSGPKWTDGDRTVLPGEGIVPLREAVDAILATGYAGLWSVELLSKWHSEWDPDVLAAEMLRAARSVLATNLANRREYGASKARMAGGPDFPIGDAWTKRAVVTDAWAATRSAILENDVSNAAYPQYCGSLLEGVYLWDVDGNRYVDYVLGYGPVVLGHGDSQVTKAGWTSCNAARACPRCGVRVRSS